MKYKTVNLHLFPIESEVSQYKIEQTINAYAEQGWKLKESKILDDSNVMLTFERN